MPKDQLIGDLAAQVGVGAKTIRYYEERGLLPTPQRGPNGYRVYNPSDERRLRFIRGARTLGFTLDEIREILALRDRDEAPCLYVLSTIDQKVSEVEERIASLQALKEELIELRRGAEGLPVDDVEGKGCVCHLIQIQALMPSRTHSRDERSIKRPRREPRTLEKSEIRRTDGCEKHAEVKNGT